MQAAADPADQKRRELAAAAPDQQAAAKQALDQADAESRRLRAENVAKVPAAEIAFVSQLPATVTAVGGAVGQVPRISGAVAGRRHPVVRAKLPASQRAKVAAGMTARIVDAVGRPHVALVSDVGAPVQPKPVLATPQRAAYVPVTLRPSRP